MAALSPRPRSASDPACRIRIGTSGYSYAEWTAAGFYPPGTGSQRMLPLYAERFGVTELNYTWYQMPKADAVARMAAKVPVDFAFAAKLTRTLTHEVDPAAWRGQAAQYRDGIAPLRQSGQLLAVLAQWPPSFQRTPANRKYLAELLDALEGLPVAVEFRHASWAVDRVFAELERRGVTLTAVDLPALAGLFPALDVVTNPALFYVRFHGRNARGWGSGHMQQQFDYDYGAAELDEWVDRRIAPMARRSAAGAVFFNNHVRAQAPRNAETLAALLAARGLG
ncbi:MAG: DUF72 domain-containing protein [Desulfobacteraceae bacterium]|jgi:uncharacterized protein YecE (DUF72 family)|nr:DUF72 domain-containing protein [Desulfobacteraceae bacterium]